MYVFFVVSAIFYHVSFLSFFKKRKQTDRPVRHGNVNTVSLLQLKSTFELAPTLHAHASITPADTDTVFLWLGANIMLAYPIAEADALLAEKLNGARASRTACDDDLDFLREQITVCFFSLKIHPGALLLV